ncbi:MAG: ribokinase [Hyphomicrobiaceae bacterium]
MSGEIVVLGVFVADTAYRAERAPRIGETLLGKSFALGPGGKGSNQAVAAARLGGDVSLITRLGNDAFADLAEQTWAEAGVKNAAVRDPASYTGAAYIFIEEATGDNAIIVCPGAAREIGTSDIDVNRNMIRSAAVFITQLEQPIEAATYALKTARDGGTTTILNPAPAATLDDTIFGFCDYVTPNETEAEELTGISVSTLEDARRAADALIARGAGSAVITLGERGALLRSQHSSEHIPSFAAGPIVETTGAGDAFNGGLAVGLAMGLSPREAVRLGCATAGISVTRPGTAPSMPNWSEVEDLMARTEM